MYDNTAGSVLVLNFKWFDVMIVKRHETRQALSEKSEQQLAEFKKLEERQPNICEMW